MATLTDNITADEERFAVSGDVSAAATKVGYRIDDEIVLLRAFGQTDPWSPRYGTDRTRWVVARGAEGTTPATHLAGATIVAVEEAVTSSTTLVPPEPFAGEGGAGGGVTVDNGTISEAVTDIVAPGAVLADGTATLGKWTLVGASGAIADGSVSVTASGENGVAHADRDATGTGVDASATAHTTVTSENGDAEANTTVTANGIQDANARTSVTAAGAGGNADALRSAQVTAAAGGGAFATTQVANIDGVADGRIVATSTNGEALAGSEAATTDGTANLDSYAFASGDGDATMLNQADVAGTGTATVGLTATRAAAVAGMTAITDATSARMGFNGATPIAKPTGVAVTAEAIHAALVSLGLIAA